MSAKPICGIYCIENLINHKKYIGQSVDIYARWAHHKSHYKQSDYLIYKAFRKYGIENFKFYVLEECKSDELNDKEIAYIKKYNTFANGNNGEGYNMTIGGEAPMKGKTHSEETKRMFSESRKGKNNSFYQHHHDRENFVRNVKVLLLNNMTVYPSMTLAAEAWGITWRNIQHCVSDDNQITAGFDADGYPLFWVKYDKTMPMEYYSYLYDMRKEQKFKTPTEKVLKNYEYYKNSDYMDNDNMYIEFVQKYIKLQNQPVVCINHGIVFQNKVEAAKYYGIGKDSVMLNCKNKIQYGGIDKKTNEFLHWIELSKYLKLTDEEIHKIVNTPIDRHQPVICINTQEHFRDAQEAANKYNLFRTGVTKCCQGIYDTCGTDKNGNRLKWEYANEYNWDAHKFNKLFIQ